MPWALLQILAPARTQPKYPECGHWLWLVCPVPALYWGEAHICRAPSSGSLWSWRKESWEHAWSPEKFANNPAAFPESFPALEALKGLIKELHEICKEIK